MRKERFWMLLLAIIIAIVSGALVGQLVEFFFPTGVVKLFFTRGVEFGIETVTVDLVALKLTFGLMLKFNVISLIFTIIVIYYFKWWVR